MVINIINYIFYVRYNCIFKNNNNNFVIIYHKYVLFDGLSKIIHEIENVFGKQNICVC